MSNATPASLSADRNLLFGILAVQMDFVSRDALIAAMNAWVMAKHRSLGEILVEQQALSAAHRDLLEPLVEAHVRGHGNDPARSLAALGSSAAPALNALQQLPDGDVQESLRQIPGTLNTDGDPYRTVAEPPGSRPRFRILRPHAKGGLGEVFVAHDEELNRPVALKEIQARHAGNRDSRGRFLLEAEITGRLEHPGVVPVYGLGAYADGRPFYAMRFIEGQDLREAIERFHAADRQAQEPGGRRLAFRELLGRFVDVCQAVAFANSRGVLHRDLKPGNVMLGKYGETLVVDWGLAKAIGRKDEAAPQEASVIKPHSGSELTPTQTGAALGTPAYMSPEQAAGKLDRLGPASDIYGLGATLYTLLTGKAPVEGTDVAEVLRKVQRGEIVPPRQAKPDAPATLEAVCRKAMALRPEDRYGSALDLAAEVEHWLADEPVSAYREPWPARAGRWVRRHRQLATGVAAVVLAAVPLSVVIAVNSDKARFRAEQDAAAIREQKERAEANETVAKENEKTAKAREAETLAVLNFVENKVFAAARPEKYRGGLGHQVTLRRAIETALPFVEHSFQHQPLVEARLRMTMGLSFRYLGDAKIAADQFQAARMIYAAHLGADHTDTLMSMNSLANSYSDLGRHADALKLDEETLALRKAKLGADHTDTLASMNNLATSYTNMGRHADALKLNEETLALRKAKLGADHPDTLRSMNNLARSYSDLGQHANAFKLYEETLALRKAKLGADDPETLSSMNNLAECYNDLGRYKEALKLHEETFALRKAKLGADHPDTLRSMHNVATSYSHLGRHDEALKLHEETLALRKAKLGADHPDTLWSMNNLADVYTHLGRHDEAIKLHEATLAVRKAKLGTGHPDTLESMYNIACCQALMVAKSDDPGKQADLAMESLKNVIAAGYNDMGQIKKDTDLDALRDREDFKKLLAEMKAKLAAEKK